MKHLVLIFGILVCLSCNEKTNSQTNEVASETNATEISEKTEIKESTDTNDQDDWYWKNTQMSTNNSFKNWEHGTVDLVMVYRYTQNNPETLEVGSISNDGILQLNLPETIQTETKVGNSANLVFYDIQDMTSLRSHNPETGYFGKTTMQVVKNGTVIGNMTLGNSVQVTYNLTNQSTLTMGDEGYLIWWVYVDGPASMKGTEETTNTVRRDGTNPIEAENTVIYDLDYKPGWNLVKTEVIGKYNLEHERGLNASLV
tara:strand:- start:95748 stop:96518 length:771 start_codon:yes stop_codon:yes gene_type:complete